MADQSAASVPPPYTAPYPPAGATPYPPAAPMQAPYPPGGAYPPYPGYQAPAPAPVQPQPVQITQPTTTTTTIIIQEAANCPKCHMGRIEESFTCAGIFLAIWCFPCGIICCLRMKRRFCNHCGHIFA